jgi:MFS family permease
MTSAEKLANQQPESETSYRWFLVAISALILGGGVGLIANGLSVFFKPLHDEFGWQRGSVSLIYLAGAMGLALGGAVMGSIADRFAVRWVSLFGLIVLGVCLIAAGRADALWQFHLLFFIAGFLGAGSLFAPLVANVGNWFKTHVGLALGIVSAGQALGQGAVPYGAAILIGGVGWREALSTMGLITLIGLAPLALLIRQAPRASTVSAENTEDVDASPVPLSTNAVIAWISVAVVFCCTCMSVPLMHLVPLVQDRGIALDDAASVLFVMMMTAVIGRIAFGKLADIIGAIPAYFTASLWQTALVFLFTQMDGLTTFYIFAVVYGFGYAGVMTGIIVCVRTLTPLSRRASALGIVTMFAWMGHALGGYQGGFFYDMIGSYSISYANAVLAGVINLVIVAALYLTINRRQKREFALAH